MLFRSSGGGAGIQADLRTFHAHGVFGTSAITAITAQNTTGVRAVETLPVAIIRAQIDAVADDFSLAATKIGMLATSEIIRAVADAIRARADIPRRDDRLVPPPYAGVGRPGLGVCGSPHPRTAGNVTIFRGATQ